AHTHFAALRVKDAVADCFREALGSRPNVDADHPDLRIHLHLNKQQASLSLDLSGDSLHKRGYRTQGGSAPLKENLAAAIVLRGDSDAEALRAARANASRAGLGGRIEWHQADSSAARPIAEAPGLLVSNPPYGERLGGEAELIKLYSLLGATLKQHFGGWRA